MPIRQSNRPDRRIADPAQISEEQVEHWLRQVRYVGSGHHKRFPANYGFVRTGRRGNKSVCDFVRTIVIEEAQTLLLEGVRKKVVSCPTTPGTFPKYIWSVSDKGEVFEAKTSANSVDYHGYPLLSSDDLHDLVLHRWER
jgi:hypothetical protein